MPSNARQLGSYCPAGTRISNEYLCPAGQRTPISTPTRVYVNPHTQDATLLSTAIGTRRIALPVGNREPFAADDKVLTRSWAQVQLGRTVSKDRRHSRSAPRLPAADICRHCNGLNGRASRERTIRVQVVFLLPAAFLARQVWWHPFAMLQAYPNLGTIGYACSTTGLNGTSSLTPCAQGRLSESAAYDHLYRLFACVCRTLVSALQPLVAVVLTPLLVSPSCPNSTITYNQYPCPPGTYTDSTSATKVSDCLPCPSGWACPIGTGGTYQPPLVRWTLIPATYICTDGTPDSHALWAITAHLERVCAGDTLG